MEKAIIKKAGGRERIQISVSEYKGKQYLDIRNFYLAEGNEWKPTPKGVSIPVELSRKVFRGIKKVASPFFESDDAVNEEPQEKLKKKKVKITEDSESKPKKKKVKTIEAKAEIKPKVRPQLDDDDEDEDEPKPKKKKSDEKIKKSKIKRKTSRI